MKRLYQVDATIYAWADDADEALLLMNAPDGATLHAYEAAGVEDEWWYAIPFGAEDNRTCGKLLVVQEEEE